MTKPAFLLKLAFPCHATDYSIYCVLKIGTTRLYYISLSLCTILFVPILLCPPPPQQHACETRTPGI